MQTDAHRFEIINFYRFVSLDAEATVQLADRLRASAVASGVGGTVLLAPEGINAAIGGLPEQVAAFLDAAITADPRFQNLDIKRSTGARVPFRRFLIRKKRWIIRFAEAGDPKPDAINAAPRMSPAELNKLLRESPQDIVLVDTRNRYEVDYGTFAGAKTLPIDRFSDFPVAFNQECAAERGKKIVFFCTGGVRCEKVVPWAQDQGFPDSWQLDGGILAYFREFGSEFWRGQCFVFDQRWIVDPKLKEANDDGLALRHQPKPLPGAPQPTRHKSYLA